MPWTYHVTAVPCSLPISFCIYGLRGSSAKCMRALMELSTLLMLDTRPFSYYHSSYAPALLTSDVDLGHKVFGLLLDIYCTSISGLIVLL